MAQELLQLFRSCGTKTHREKNDKNVYFLIDREIWSWIQKLFNRCRGCGWIHSECNISARSEQWSQGIHLLLHEFCFLSPFLSMLLLFYMSQWNLSFLHSSCYNVSYVSFTFCTVSTVALPWSETFSTNQILSLSRLSSLSSFKSLLLSRHVIPSLSVCLVFFMISLWSCLESSSVQHLLNSLGFALSSHCPITPDKKVKASM